MTHEQIQQEYKVAIKNGLKILAIVIFVKFCLACNSVKYATGPCKENRYMVGYGGKQK